MKITISKENYLKAIAEAESEGETVKAATLSRWLNVTAPAVTMAIKRLKRDGMILVGEEGHITLTSAGREIANRILNRHHLIERMLAEIFGMEWYKVHDEAEQHVQPVQALRPKVAAVGWATAQAAKNLDLRVDYVAQTHIGESLAAELVRFLDERGLDRPHVAGNSLGGVLALGLAVMALTALAGFFHYIRVGPDETDASDEAAARELAKQLEKTP